MGWGRYLLLGDLGQQLDLADQAEEIQRLKRQVQRPQRECNEVREQCQVRVRAKKLLPGREQLRVQNLLHAW